MQSDRQVALARRHFERLAGAEDAAIDLAEAALWIAAEHYPGLVPAPYLGELDRLAEAARPRVDGAPDERGRIEALLQVLTVERGFRGNRDDYYDPRNSYLNDVLERRRGIPITLSLVLVEVAQRLGLHASGIAFPGHFLAKIVGAEEVVVDAFEGRIVPEAECQQRLERALGPDAHFDRGWLRTAGNKEILARVLRNLKQIHATRNEYEAALACCDRLLLLEPDSALELRDRGLVLRELECPRAALDDLERFLALAPEHPSAGPVRQALDAIRMQAQRLH